MKKIEAFCACLCLIGSMKLVPAYAADAQSLRLNDAIHMALNSAPYIRGADADYGAAKSERRQAGTFINPEIGLSAENIAGSGAYKGTDEAEITLGLSQTVEVGGKRSARIKLADHGESVAQYGQSVARLNTIRDVKAAFAQAAAAQEEAVIAQEQFKLAQDVYKNVDKRVSAAAEPLVQRHKAKISMVNAELVLERAKTQKNTAFKMLTSLWGNHVISSVDKSDFYKITKPTTNKDIQNLLQHTIDYKQKSVAVDQAKSSIDLEKANAIPDPTFNG
jgi:cobalt-zinc-cadmium efflux system outer membrane protein